MIKDKVQQLRLDRQQLFENFGDEVPNRNKSKIVEIIIRHYIERDGFLSRG